jgi:hypothetical protein
MGLIVKTLKITGLMFIMLGLTAAILPAGAQTEKTALTITPPLVKISVNPGETWSSAVKIANNNLRDITVNAQILDFKSGPDGGVVFLNKGEAGKEWQNFLLSDWVSVATGSIPVAAQQSVEVPYTITVPTGAEPGGHYAAVVVGTKANENIEGSGMKISSLLASLILLEVQGNVKEDGSIREFRVAKSINQEPNIEFNVSFQNKGNIHLQPQGEIVIYDMWNREAGKVFLNHQTEFGNVLPQSTRDWKLSWAGEGGLTKMGRYRAMLVLTYGASLRETVDQTLTFWVIDFKVLGITAGGFLIGLLLVIGFIRLYIRRAVRESQLAAGLISPLRQARRGKISIIPKESVNGRGPNGAVNIGQEQRVAPGGRWKTFKRWLIFIAALMVMTAGAAVYISGREPKKENEPLPGPDKIDEVITAKEPLAPAPEILSGTTTDDIASTAPAATKDALSGTTTKETLVIKVLNGSGLEGLAKKAAQQLTLSGWPVAAVGNADNYDYSTIVIKYRRGEEKNAVLVGAVFPGVLEMEAVAEQTEDIIVIVGRDFKGE